MTQHFLKSAKARDFTLFDVAQMTEFEAIQCFARLRWGSDDHQVCPYCGVIDRHYFLRSRKRWRCKSCQSYFSATRGTPLQDHKLPYKKMLMGIMFYCGAANGVSLHQFARVLDVQVKTAQSFIGRLREALYFARPTIKLSGTVQMDGGYFGGRPRHGRIRKRKDVKDITAYVEGKLAGKGGDRAPRSKISKANWKRRQKRRVVMVVRELHPEKGLGGRCTIVAVSSSENEQHAVHLATTHIEPGALVMTDENAAYNQLSKWFRHEAVEHSYEFAREDGVNDNQAESYFSRLRRYVLGVALRIEPKYLADIAVEMAWREDMRRRSEGEKLAALIKALCGRGLSRWWRGYWQGCHRNGELALG